MKNAKKTNEKTSLEKSHSAWSNTKLTFLCIFSILVYSMLWVSVGLLVFKVITNALIYVMLGVFALLTILSLLMFNKFKR